MAFKKYSCGLVIKYPPYVSVYWNVLYILKLCIRIVFGFQFPRSLPNSKLDNYRVNGYIDIVIVF